MLGKIADFRNAQTRCRAHRHHRLQDGLRHTTGIKPDLALVKYKKLVGGGVVKIVNNTVPENCKLGYNTAQIAAIVVDHIDSSNSFIEGAPHAQARAPVGIRLRVSGRRTASTPSITWATCA